jgi:hypothetical protein
LMRVSERTIIAEMSPSRESHNASVGADLQSG